MKAHPGITRVHLVQKGPASIALMVASEFGRASNRNTNENNVRSCYRRARELMGVLETLSLPPAVSRRLKPLYTRATERELFLQERMVPEFIRKSCAELADAFTRAAAFL
jgi:hypothetical protein